MLNRHNRTMPNFVLEHYNPLSGNPAFQGVNLNYKRPTICYLDRRSYADSEYL